MYKSPYDITPQQSQEYKKPRDTYQFPRSLPSNSHLPIHKLTDFTDRQTQNGRKKRELLPVQNDYLQRYQIHNLQEYQINKFQQNQFEINQVMDRKPKFTASHISRNEEQANFIKQQPPIPINFLQTPEDTRKEKLLLNNPQREPLGRVLGLPPDRRL